MTLMRSHNRLGDAVSQQRGAEAGQIAGSFIPIPGANVVLSAIGSFIGSLFGNTKVLTTQEILDAVTPSVVNNLENAGYTLPAGQEQQYVQAALTGQIQPPQVNYLIPAGIAGFALWLVLSEKKQS